MPAHCYPLLATSYETMLADVGNLSGTYRLRLWNVDLCSFTSIPRLLKADPEGVLYIGTSERAIVSRVATLQHAVGNAYDLPDFNRSKTHTCANAMRELFRQEIDPKRLCIEFSTFECSKRYENYKTEWDLLQAYFDVFGEFPPMNGLKPSKRCPVPASIQG